jgi:hypothetical protein
MFHDQKMLAASLFIFFVGPQQPVALVKLVAAAKSLTASVCRDKGYIPRNLHPGAYVAVGEFGVEREVVSPY